jgi:hypothetical protein
MIRIYRKFGMLTKISKNQNALRTNTVEGTFYGPPCAGFSFKIYSTPLTPSHDYREVTTSIVQSVELTDYGFRFKTVNSIYDLYISSEVGESLRVH